MSRTLGTLTAIFLTASAMVPAFANDPIRVVVVPGADNSRTADPVVGNRATTRRDRSAYHRFFTNDRSWQLRHAPTFVSDYGYDVRPAPRRFDNPLAGDTEYAPPRSVTRLPYDGVGLGRAYDYGYRYPEPWKYRRYGETSQVTKITGDQRALAAEREDRRIDKFEREQDDIQIEYYSPREAYDVRFPSVVYLDSR